MWNIIILIWQVLFLHQILKNQLLKEKIYKKSTGKNWDNRTRFQIYENKKKINNDIVIRFQPSYFLNKQNLSIFPLSGISNSETIHCNENGYFSIYQSDRFGFNNPDLEIPPIVQVELIEISEKTNVPKVSKKKKKKEKKKKKKKKIKKINKPIIKQKIKK